MRGLNGWFGKALKKLIGVAKSIIASTGPGGAALSGMIDSALDQLTDNYSGAFWNKGIDYEPTAQESYILEALTVKLRYFINRMYTTIDEAQYLSIQQQIDVYNNVLKQINFVRQYYALYDLDGLSSQAIELRNHTINVMMAVCESKLDEIFAYNNVFINLVQTPFTVTGSQTQLYTPLIVASTSNSYTYPQIQISPVYTGVTILAPIFRGESNPGDTTDVVVTNPIYTTTTGGTTNTTPVSTVPTNALPAAVQPNTVVAAASNNWGMIKKIGFLAAAYFGYRWAYSEE